MPTEYLIELSHWDRSLHLAPNPGGIPEEHTFRGELLFVRGLEIEGRIQAPPRHRGKRFRGWLSKLWLPEPDERPRHDVGGVTDRAMQAGEQELLANLYAPEAAFETASVCLGTSWRFLRVITEGRRRAVVEFSFSRADPRGAP